MTEASSSFPFDDITVRAQETAHHMLEGSQFRPEHVLKEEILSKVDWHNRVEQEVQVALQDREPLSALLMDIDGFKAVNDDFGHDVGDRVIAETRSLLHEITTELGIEVEISQGRSRSEERAKVDENHPVLSQKPVDGHIGGDEFAILLHCDKEGAEIIKQLIKERFVDFLGRPENSDLQTLRLGIAIGIGMLEENGSKSQLLHDADEDMYQDKINNLPQLTDEQKRELRTIQYLAEQANIRLRDLPKYFKALERDF
jgi:GGDEF domain-containing protein